MKTTKYIESVVARESKDYSIIIERIGESEVRMLHASMGLATEAGEFVDAMKKWLFYGKDPGRANLEEELGDILWYVALAADELGVTFEDLMKKNDAKLEARYGPAFSEEKAINRDLKKELKVLEK
jgi:NTP pyrophosphatase (non-canonical NTP hydrolase)